MPEDIAARRWLYLFVVLASTVAAVTEMTGIFEVDGFTWREIVILVLFGILFAWIASSFWLAAFGAFARFTKTDLLPLKRPSGVSAARTAILMPVYNEDVARFLPGCAPSGNPPVPILISTSSATAPIPPTGWPRSCNGTG